MEDCLAGVKWMAGVSEKDKKKNRRKAKKTVYLLELGVYASSVTGSRVLCSFFFHHSVSPKLIFRPLFVGSAVFMLAIFFISLFFAFACFSSYFLNKDVSAPNKSLSIPENEKRQFVLRVTRRIIVKIAFAHSMQIMTRKIEIKKKLNYQIQFVFDGQWTPNSSCAEYKIRIENDSFHLIEK